MKEYKVLDIRKHEVPTDVVNKQAKFGWRPVNISVGIQVYTVLFERDIGAFAYKPTLAEYDAS